MSTAWATVTLTSIRAILRDLVAGQALTDANIYYMDGLELFDEVEAKTMPDGIHPDAAGYRRIGANFVAKHPPAWRESVS